MKQQGLQSVGIIGYQGIGAAHAVAVARSGYGWVSHIVDTDVAAVQARIGKRSYGPRAMDYDYVYSNQWGTIVEEATTHNRPEIVQPERLTSDFLASCDVDLWIVAVPNESKHHYVDLLLMNGAKRILVEKPFAASNYGEQVSVGLEWMYHPMLNNLIVNGPFTVAMFHNEPVQEHYGSAETDLLPHAMSIALRLRGEGAFTKFEQVEYAVAHHTDSMTFTLGRGTSRRVKVIVGAGTHIITSDAVITLPWVDLFDLQLFGLDEFQGADRLVERAISAAEGAK